MRAEVDLVDSVDEGRPGDEEEDEEIHHYTLRNCPLNTLCLLLELLEDRKVEERNEEEEENYPSIIKQKSWVYKKIVFRK